VGSVLGPDGNVPPSVVVQGFRTLTPTAEVTRYVTLWERLWNDEYVASYQAMTGWSDDHVPFPGAAARETVEMLVRNNGMVTDRLTPRPRHLGRARHRRRGGRAQRSLTCPAATSSRRVVATDSSIRRSWVTSSSVPS
jgi:polyhydroxyalkanoate synthase subunit PhaC